MGLLSAIAGPIVGNLVGKAFGGGSRQATSQQQTIPGVEFQPFTYKGTSGSVTGAPSEDGYGYEWSADVAPWISDLGALGSAEAGGLFQKYLSASQVDPYAAAEEYYQRGLGVLEPEIAKQRNALAGGLFGSGRLGLKLAGEGLGYGSGAGQVNPDVAGFGAGVGKAYTNLYANALQAGQDLQTNYINQLNDAANQMLELGMTPAEVEQNLIKFASNLETARSNARKSGVQNVNLAETPQSVFAGDLAKTVGKGVTGLFSGSNDGGWVGPEVTGVYDTNAFATGGGNPFWS